ncbi:MAG: ABC transporter ATP-binding protein [Crenarchaeota archaeon]|nr:ABC transporter ATP-binding protein [Thermoproteota archaeon]
MRILEVRDLRAGYGKRIVVDGVSIEVRKGEFLCIVGPNGAGKTTVLRCILGLLKPMEGAVLVNGKSVYEYKPRELAKRVSAVLTERADPGMLRVWEVVALGRYPHTGPLSRMSERDLDIVEECLELVGARHLRNKLFSELSDGERQKVLIARALAQEPRILVLDEPTTFLDLRHRIEIARLLRKLAREKRISIVATMHDISLAMRVCDRVVLVKEGHVVASGFPEDVLTEDMVSEVYELPRGAFDEDTGCVELGPEKEGERAVFVVGGYGTAAKLCRFLARQGLRVSIGILLDLDIDYRLCMRVAHRVLHAPSPEAIDSSVIEEAARLIESSEAVIDSGFPLSDVYRHNEELLRYAYEMEIPIACRRRSGVVPCHPFESLSQLASFLSRLLL